MPPLASHPGPTWDLWFLRVVCSAAALFNFFVFLALNRFFQSCRFSEGVCLRPLTARSLLFVFFYFLGSLIFTFGDPPASPLALLPLVPPSTFFFSRSIFVLAPSSLYRTTFDHSQVNVRPVPRGSLGFTTFRKGSHPFPLFDIRALRQSPLS